MLITHVMLNSLSDEECIIFHKLMNRKNYSLIQWEMSLSRYDLSFIVNRIYVKLDVYPRHISTLRMVWANSLINESYNREEHKKIRAIAELQLPVSRPNLLFESKLNQN